MKIHQYTMLCAPILSQEAAIEALEQCGSDVAHEAGIYAPAEFYARFV